MLDLLAALSGNFLFAAVVTATALFTLFTARGYLPGRQRASLAGVARSLGEKLGDGNEVTGQVNRLIVHAARGEGQEIRLEVADLDGPADLSVADGGAAAHLLKLKLKARPSGRLLAVLDAGTLQGLREMVDGGWVAEGGRWSWKGEAGTQVSMRLREALAVLPGLRLEGDLDDALQQRLLAERDRALQRDLVHALARRNAVDAEALRPLLDDDDERFVVEVARVMGAAGQGALVRRLSHSQRQVQVRAALALAGQTPLVEADIVERVLVRGLLVPELAPDCVQALGKVGGPRAYRALEEHGAAEARQAIRARMDSQAGRVSVVQAATGQLSVAEKPGS